jgi:hypothetical protein
MFIGGVDKFGILTNLTKTFNIIEANIICLKSSLRVLFYKSYYDYQPIGYLKI